MQDYKAAEPYFAKAADIAVKYFGVSDGRTLSIVLTALVGFDLCAHLHLGKSLTSTVTGYSMHNDQVSSVGKIIVLHHTVALFELGNMATK